MGVGTTRAGRRSLGAAGRISSKNKSTRSTIERNGKFLSKSRTLGKRRTMRGGKVR